MYTRAPSATFAPDLPHHRIASLSAPTPLRSALIVCCLASVVLAIAIGQPSAALLANPELAFLLRGMAILKAGMVVAAVAVVFWRFGLPIQSRTAAVYVLGIAALAGASVLIWRLSSIPLAALVFHLAGFAVLVSAWRDKVVRLKLPHGAV